MEVYLPYSGTNGKEVLMPMTIKGEFTSVPNVTLVDGTTEYGMTYIASTIYNDRIEAFVNVPAISGGDSRLLNLKVTYDLVDTLFENVFLLTKYASPEHIRYLFGISANEVDDYSLYNIIVSSKENIRSWLDGYITDDTLDWEIGNVPNPIALLHEYEVALEIVRLKYPDRVDKADVLQKAMDELRQKIVLGEMEIDNITAMARLKVVGVN